MKALVALTKVGGGLMVAFVLAVSALLLQRAWKIDRVGQFCSDVGVGDERGAVLAAARRDGLVATEGTERDVVSIRGWMVFTWCIVHHEGGKVVSRVHKVE